MTIAKSLFALVGIQITDAMLISSVASEDPSPEWLATEDYELGDIVHRPSTHRRYKCAAPGINATPPEQDKDRWKELLGATNRWNCFDQYAGTRTKMPSGTTITLRPGYFNAIEIRGVRNCNGVHIVGKKSPGGADYFEVEDDMEGSEPGDDWEYWYMPFFPKERLLVMNLEPFANAEVSLTFTSASGEVELGLLTIGDLRPLAATLNGAEAEFVDFSYIDIDEETGEYAIEKGPAGRDLNVTGWLPAEDAKYVDRAMLDLLGRPAVIIASTEDQFEGLTTYGLVEGSIKHPDRTQALLNFRARGLPYDR